MKYSVGEKGMECLPWTGEWQDCEIVAIGWSSGGKRADYRINVPTQVDPENGGTMYGANEKYLRKKPQQKDDKAADEEFIKELNNLLNLEVKA